MTEDQVYEQALIRAHRLVKEDKVDGFYVSKTSSGKLCIQYLTSDGTDPNSKDYVEE